MRAGGATNKRKRLRPFTWATRTREMARSRCSNRVGRARAPYCFNRVRRNVTYARTSASVKTRGRTRKHAFIIIFGVEPYVIYATAMRHAYWLCDARTPDGNRCHRDKGGCVSRATAAAAAGSRTSAVQTAGSRARRTRSNPSVRRVYEYARCTTFILFIYLFIRKIHNTTRVRFVSVARRYPLWRVLQRKSAWGKPERHAGPGGERPRAGEGRTSPPGRRTDRRHPDS